MESADPGRGGGHEAAGHQPAFVVDDRLRRFDHQLHPHRVGGEPESGLDPAEHFVEHGRFLRLADLGKGDDERAGEPTGPRHQRRQEEIEGAEAPLPQLRRERLHPDSGEGRQRAGLESPGHFGGGRFGVGVLLGVRAMAVAVLEIDPEVLHRLAGQFPFHPLVDGGRQPGGQSDRRRQRLGRRRVRLEHGEGDPAEARGRVESKEVGAAVDDVNGATGAVSGVGRDGEAGLGALQPGHRGPDRIGRETCGHVS